jgi:hypothetical protein
MTKKGDRCKREARRGSGFCAIHQDQEIRPKGPRPDGWDADSIVKAAVGIGLVVTIFLCRFRR